MGTSHIFEVPLLNILVAVAVVSSSHGQTLLASASQYHMNVYQPLCRTEKKDVFLNSDEFEYFPKNYTDEECVQENMNFISHDTSMCLIPGFRCVTSTYRITILKRSIDSDGKPTSSWEPHQPLVKRCDCMLPSFSRTAHNFEKFLRELAEPPQNQNIWNN